MSSSIGWCDDGTGTGSGYCSEGNSKGPIHLQLSASNLESSLVKPAQSGNKSVTGLNNQNKHLTDITNRIINLESLFSMNKNELDPYSKPSRSLSTSRQSCNADRWFYTGEFKLKSSRIDKDSFFSTNSFSSGCPLCQCHGHSFCKHNSSICNKPCAHETTGEQCQECRAGFFGNPINGM